jgi:hypothetical protein
MKDESYFRNIQDGDLFSLASNVNGRKLPNHRRAEPVQQPTVFRKDGTHGYPLDNENVRPIQCSSDCRVVKLTLIEQAQLYAEEACERMKEVVKAKAEDALKDGTLTAHYGASDVMALIAVAVREELPVWAEPEPTPLEEKLLKIYIDDEVDREDGWRGPPANVQPI